MTTKIMTRLGTGLVTAAILATSVAPAFAANINVSGNGRKSNNNVNVNNNKTTVVSQSSSTTVVNGVSVNQNTGNNKSHDNIGGSGITSGDTNANVNLAVTGGSNTYVSQNCGCMDMTNVNVSGNMRMSNNNVNLNNSLLSILGQSSTTTVLNSVGVNQNSGNNHSHDNVGGSAVTSGDANTNVNTMVHGGSNLAL